MNGRLVSKQTILQGSTIGYLDVSTVYKGNYLLRITTNNQTKVMAVSIGN